MKKKIVIGSLLLIGLLMTMSCTTAAVDITTKSDQKTLSMDNNRQWPPALWNFVKNRYYALQARAEFWSGLSGNPYTSAFYPLISYHADALFVRSDIWVIFWLSISERLGWGWPEPLTA